MNHTEDQIQCPQCGQWMDAELKPDDCRDPDCPLLLEAKSPFELYCGQLEALEKRIENREHPALPTLVEAERIQELTDKIRASMGPIR